MSFSECILNLIELKLNLLFAFQSVYLIPDNTMNQFKTYDMRKNVLLFVLLVISVLGYSQSKSIIGSVTDCEDGSTLVGVSVFIKGTTQGTTTDVDGNFLLDVKVGDVLVFSFVGMTDKEVLVDEKSAYKVELCTGQVALDEYVVVGYGSVRKSDLTGSVTSVKVKDAESSGSNSVNDFLQGRAAGVNVQTNSGVPGGSVNINIRGIGSMSASSQPLYVIDGIIIDGTSSDITDEDLTETNPMAFLSPEDIESIEILKDASATAIYGSRGANGVVLITTKSGEESGYKIEYNASAAFADPTKKLNVMDGLTYANYRNDLAALMGLSPVYTNFDSIEAINWQNEMMQRAITKKHRLSISGGQNGSKYFVSFGYNASDGVIKSTGFSKYDFRTNFTHKLSNKIKFISNISGSMVQNDLTVGTDYYGGDKSMIGSILNTKPILNDFLDEAGIFDAELMDINNPYAWQDGYLDNTQEKTLVSKFSLEFALADWITYTARVGVNYRSKVRNRYWGRELYKGERSDGYAQSYDWDNFHYVVDNLFFFKYRIKKHRFNATLGFTYDEKMNKYNKYEALGFIDDFAGFDAMHAGATQVITSTTKTPSTYASSLFRINYAYKNKISATVTGRADGSSKFAEGNQWGFFPSTALAYRLSEEDFVKNIKAISDLKLRLGWGQVGSSSSPAYATINHINYVLGTDDEGNTVTTLRPSTMGNPDLTWETSQQSNLGLDVELWKGKLIMTFDAYYKTTKDQLQNLALPGSSGYSSMWVNLGKVENKGVEFSFDYQMAKEKLKFSFGGNIAFNQNKILEIGRVADDLGRVFYLGDKLGGNDEIKAPVNVFMEGQPVGAFWGFHTDGILQDAADAAAAPTFYGIQLAEGNIKFRDISGPDGIPDGNIDGYDKDIIGDPNPDFIYGVNMNISYKALNLYVLFQGVQGRDLFNANYARLWNHERFNTNKLEESYLEAWTADNPTNFFPRIDYNPVTFNSVFTDRFVEDASYFKLSTISLSYNLELKKIAAIESIKFYASAHNVFIITNYKGYDPEADSFASNPMLSGVDFNSYPAVRTIMFGLNVIF